MGNWANLLPDILLLILKKLISSCEDFTGSVVFGEVCTSWRSIYIQGKDLIKQLPPQVIWLMLAEEEDTNKRGFFSLAKGNTRYLQLPEAQGKFCFSFPQGWLITAGEDFGLNLLHLLSRVQFQLPNLRTVPESALENTSFPMVINRALLTANPSLTSDFKVIIVFDSDRLAFAKLGDNAWTVIKETHSFSDVTCYEGNIYGLNWRGYIWVCDIEGSEPKATILFRIQVERFVPHIERAYLVESSGKLLAVLRIGVEAMFESGVIRTYEGTEIYAYGTTQFLVFELNISNRSWTRLESLENRALFVGHNSSISVNAWSICGCKANSIYFTDDTEDFYVIENGAYGLYSDLTERGGGRDMGVWNMVDGSIEPLFNPPSYCRVAPPLWVFPNFP
ncbi:F-box protein [Quillaja saponaria]|uniref:F-box protein n=1 Tax=Quillaja saponaria TaxID=32244 RepID=A0AAD7LNW9_QUISA|nr:F-box protein [Quillaja saponaria]